MECDAMLFGGQVPAFQRNISTNLPASRVKTHRKQNIDLHNQENLKLYKLY